MGFTTDGADKALKAITGEAVTVATSTTMTAHTANPPTSGNQLSGNGYSAHTYTAATDFTGLTTVTGYRRLTLADAEFFADAGANAQTIQAVAINHGSTVVYTQALEIVPNNARVFVDDAKIELQMTASGIRLTTNAADRALRAGIGGLAMTAQTMYFALHSGAQTPTTANLVTGGGLVPVEDDTWTYGTTAGFRRATHGAITFTTALSADTNAEPSRIALWGGDPSDSNETPTLHVWAPVSPANMTAAGSSITVAANALYFGINLDGVAA